MYAQMDGIHSRRGMDVGVGVGVFGLKCAVRLVFQNDSIVGVTA